MEFGKLEIRPDDRVAFVDGCALTLTARELELLTALAQNPDRVMTREELMQRVWHRGFDPRDRSVDVYIGRLRSKLGAALPGASFIHTHSGLGYRFSASA